MAIVQINRIGSIYGPSLGSMPSFNLLDWNAVDTNASGTSATLLNSRSAPVSYLQSASITGTGLNITPDRTPVISPIGGPALSTRVATGTITGLSFAAGVDSHTVANYYSIIGLSISFQSLLANGADPNLQTDRGLSALSLAQQKNRQDIVELVRKRMR